MPMVQVKVEPATEGINKTEDEYNFYSHQTDTNIYPLDDIDENSDENYVQPEYVYLPEVTCKKEISCARCECVTCECKSNDTVSIFPVCEVKLEEYINNNSNEVDTCLNSTESGEENVTISQINVNSEKSEEVAPLDTDKISRQKQWKIFHCNGCNFKTDETWKIKRHIQSHYRQNPEIHVSYSCSYRATDNPRYICYTCQYGTCRKRDLTRHILTHSNAKSFICKFCKSGFNVKALLHSHLLNKHKHELNNFKELLPNEIRNCYFCEYQTVYKRSLDEHLRKCHNYMYPKDCKEAKFKCDHCGYQTLRKGDYNRHLRSHSAVKPFKCEFCKKGFNIKRQIDSHLLKRHKLEVSNLDDVLTNKIHNCPFCDYQTVYSSNCTRHMISRHNDQVHKEPVK